VINCEKKLTHLEDRRSGPEIKEYGWSLEVGRRKKTDSPLKKNTMVI
jgi:hypothetical protein